MSLLAPDEWKPQGIDDLEAGAWNALRECSDNVCVTAGAGAGKTEFLAQKATYLLQTGICPNPKRILAISFKRDAAVNLAKRVEERCPEHARRFTSMTFDGFSKGFIDRFRSAIPTPYTPPIDYQVGFPNSRDLQDFLSRRGYHGISASQLLNRIATTPLPLDEDQNALSAYWNSQFSEHQEVILTFPMINRLVEWLIRENTYIQRALRSTYSFVFLDEFQDTTYPQFDLLKTAFLGSNSVFTAVGDKKQCIMGWAGAMDDSFSELETQFDARPIELLSHWRSHEDLVHIQHAIAQTIDPTTNPSQARSLREVDGAVSAIWQYQDTQQEANGLAAWLAEEIQNELNPNNCVIIVRKRADLAEEELKDTFSAHGVQLRNVDRRLGEISIQDILEEPLTNILIPLLRLGAAAHDPASWNQAFDNLLMLENVSTDDERSQQRLQQNLQDFTRSFRQTLAESPPSESAALDAYNTVTSFLTVDSVKNVSPTYRRQQDFDRVCDGFKLLLQEYSTAGTQWTEVLNQLEGIGQIPLMTIHKSKGLEFHTVIFHGLDDQSWWSLTPNRPEELKAFFVAFTRAKQRVFFTLNSSKGRSVTWIENLVASTGVERITGPKVEASALSF